MKKSVLVVISIVLLVAACSPTENPAPNVPEVTSNTNAEDAPPTASSAFVPTQTLAPTQVPVTRELPEDVSKLITRGPVYSLAVSPDKKLIALGAAGGIYLLDGVDYHEINFLPAENFVQLVTSLTFTADNNRLVASAYTDNVNNRLFVYDLDKSEMIHKMDGIPNPMGTNPGMKVTTTQINTNLIIASLLNNAFSWNLETNEWKPLFKSGDPIWDIAPSSDGTVYLATGERVISIDPLTGKIINRLEGVFNSRTLGITVSQNGKLAAATQKGRVVVWDVENGDIIIDESYDGINDQLIYALLARPTFSENDEFVFYAEKDELSGWDTRTGEKIAGLKFSNPDARQHYFTHSVLLAGNRILTVDKLGEINIWSLDEKVIIYTSNKFTPGDPYWAAISPDEKKVAVAQSDGFGSNGLRIYDAISGDLLHSIETESYQQNLRYSPQGTYLHSDSGMYNAKTYTWVCGSRLIFYSADDGMFAYYAQENGSLFLVIVSMPDCKVVRSFENKEDNILAISRNFDYVLSSQGGSQLDVFDVKTGELRKTITINAFSPSGAMTNDDGKYILLFNQNQTRVYDITTGEEIGRIAGTPLRSRWSRDFYPVFSHNKVIIDNGIIEVWDIEKVEKTVSITGFDEWLDSYDIFDVSPDGKLLAGSKSKHGEGSQVDVVDLSTGQLLYSFLTGPEYFSYGTLFEFTHDSQRLLTSSRFGQVILWNTSH
ncbi:MAG: WD40 repeat domain-containing protein [Chloroflexi bacterium]|nr:WD40 repeat domain-containing protein [Chloroflexota bacterium]